MNKPLLVVMAGGTGGHVFPGLAVASEMQTQGWDVHWIGTADKMEAQLVPKYGFPIHFIKIGGARGKSLLTKLQAPFKLLGALIQAIKLLRVLQPQAVLGMGGYASGPGGIAAWLLGVPLVVHEQNAVFGMTNRYLAKVAQFTLSGFDLSAVICAKNSPKLVAKTHYVGNPIRPGFFAIEEKQSSANAPINILIVGGSLGALALNQIVPNVLSELSAQFTLQLRHQSGKGKNREVKEAYKQMPNASVVEFIDDMESAFAWSDIIICRAGALTVAEVAGSGRVAIFVPLPIAVDDHQSENAKYLSEQGAALLLPQATLATTLLASLRELCAQPNKRLAMAKKARACAHPDATQQVGQFITKAAKSLESFVHDTDNSNGGN